MSDWTVDTLKEHVEKILAEKDKAINIALAAAKEAVGVAETNAEKWRDNANEWRGAMSDREKKFLSREEFLAFKESSEKALKIEKERADRGEGRGVGLNAFWGYLIGGIGLVLAILSLIDRFV
jgi:hypothetical protein